MFKLSPLDCFSDFLCTEGSLLPLLLWSSIIPMDVHELIVCPSHRHASLQRSQHWTPQWCSYPCHQGGPHGLHGWGVLGGLPVEHWGPIWLQIMYSRELTFFNFPVVQLVSRVWLFMISWTAACQDPLSVELSRQEYWSGLPFPSPGDLPSPGIEPMSPALAGRFFTTETQGKTFLFLPIFSVRAT